jgi:hypothetical protein
MPDTFIKIATVTVGSGGSATMTFSSIPQTYTDLCLKVSGRSDATGSVWRNYTLSFNGAGYASNMTGRGLYGTGSAAASETLGNAIGQFSTSDSATASTFSNSEIYIPNYTGASNKSYSADSVTENNATAALAYFVAGLWSDTPAITSITLGNESPAIFKQYTTATLYGISKT